MTAPVVFLWGLPGQAQGPLSDDRFAGRIDLVDQYALTPALLERRRAVFLSMHNDQRWLQKHGALLSGFIEQGGTVLAQGQLVLPWHPILQPYVPIRRPPLPVLEIKRVADHPIFDGIDPGLLNCRRGVRGFYGRGHTPPPEGATVIQTLGNGLPLDWHIAVGKGRLFMHAGNDLWTNMENLEDNLKLADQAIDWAAGGNTA